MSFFFENLQKDQLDAESEKDEKLKKLEREKEVLQTRLGKALEDKNIAICDVDDFKNQTRLLNKELGGRGAKILELETTTTELTR